MLHKRKNRNKNKNGQGAMRNNGDNRTKIKPNSDALLKIYVKKASKHLEINAVRPELA